VGGRFTPLLAEAARPCQHTVGTRWWVDETYVKVAGRWRYVYRAIDQSGQVIDMFASPRRDASSARRFFQRALGTSKLTPREVITDLAPTYPMGAEGSAAGRMASHRSVCQQPDRSRSWSAQGTIAVDARVQAGPQCPG
jgi:transposase-like protein